MTAERDPAARRDRRRALLDRAATRLVGVSGLGVIAAVGGILLFLLWVVTPLFASARIETVASFPVPAPEAGPTLRLSVEDSNEIAWRVTGDGHIAFFDPRDGTLLALEDLPGDGAPARVHRPDPQHALLALEDDAGALRFLELAFPVSFAGGERTRGIRPGRPFGGEPFEAGTGPGLLETAVHYEAPALTVVRRYADGTLRFLSLPDAERGASLSAPTVAERRSTLEADRMILAGPQWLFLLAADGRVEAWNVQFPDAPFLGARGRLTDDGTPPRAVEPLPGGRSLLVADGTGRVVQWFLQREGAAWRFASPRRFDAPGAAPAITDLLPETRRRGFLLRTADGTLALYHSTADRLLARLDAGLQGPATLGLSPRADLLLADDGAGRVHSFAVENRHPEVSFAALWREVWYEDYPEADHVWQSSASSTDFEPKFGLTPLAFGTLKAAAYALLFAVPLAILGAIYTAFFMAPGMRAWVKPGIEIMAALPTVVLGFLGGLWLAPLVEARLLTVLALLVLLPLGVLALSALWFRAPGTLRARVPEGWHALLLVPVIVLLVAAIAAVAPQLEAAVFDGDLRGWLRVHWGLGYDQRNALVVGMMMGIAVLPVIFAITEDAIHDVPRRLVNGSLALGATPWQTLVHVVLPAASPAVFSALVIGLGRAVGETMIVLMATGNTPLMDWSAFEGMRTFAANIAVELPESEVGSTHYRILFLTALVLFAVTFVLNTGAEIVRQGLRRRYGEL
ncbi:MAG: ABC transporter permease subunit [Pseudomonadales bacterium]|nr:ABC transporter permease subunit [Pseudomonadales bacterium]